MSQIETEHLTHGFPQEVVDELRLTHYEGIRAEYEAKRDYYQLLMDTVDKLILEIQKSKTGA